MSVRAEEGPGEPCYLVMVKAKNELRAYSLKTGAVLKTYRAISGFNPGDKQREGDKKTPEGIYFVTRQIPKGQLAALHGAAAFELNYPNLFDRLVKHSGSGIWIHGVDQESRMEKKFDTRGCIALSNKDVVDLAPFLKGDPTPVFVLSGDTDNGRAGFEAPGGPYGQRFTAWIQAWNSKDPEPYLQFYDERMKSRGMDFKTWANYKRRLTKQYKKISVVADDVRILQHDKYAISFFTQDYSSDRYHARHKKVAYWVGGQTDARILSEEVVGQEVSELLKPTPEMPDTPLPIPTSDLSSSTKENTTGDRNAGRKVAAPVDVTNVDGS